MDRLGSTVARLKLKGIDGGSHKRWRMWLNSRLREEPYPSLDMLRNPSERRECSQESLCTGAAWLSSARVVRCRVKSHNERNPCLQLPARHGGDSGETAQENGEEGGDDVKSAWPLCLGLHTCYNGRSKGQQTREGEQIPKNAAQFRSKAATRLREVGIASNRRSATLR